MQAFTYLYVLQRLGNALKEQLKGFIKKYFNTKLIIIDILQKIREREFFKISPETAFGIFNDIATLRGDRSCLKPYAPTEEQAQEEEIAENKMKRRNNSFELLGISIGEELPFLLDNTITAKVCNNKNKVEYKGELYTVTALATKLLVETQSWSENAHVNGWRYFVKDGITLSELREKVEQIECDE